MASQVTVTTASAGTSSPQLVPQKTIFDMLQDVQKRIQLYGPGPYTSEQVKELEKLKTIYVRLKSEHEKAIQETKMAAGPRPTAVMTPVTQVLAPVQVASPGMVQIPKLAPATTALPTQLTTVLPATTMASVMPAVTAKTILPQPSLTQVQTHNVVMNPANIQQLQRSAEVAQMKVTSAQAPHLHVTQTPVQTVTPGQQLTISGKPLVAQQLPASAIKTVTVTTTPLQVTQGTPQTVTLQRTLVPSKSPVNLPITLAPSGTVSANVPAGSHSITNIAPAPVPVTLSKGLHSATQMTGKALTGASMRSDTSSPQPNQVLTKRRLQELLHEIDPREQMDDDVEDLLLQIADDFIESVVSASCQIAKHRKSNTLEVRDVQLHLERCWNMWVPGFGSDELRPFKKQATTEAHKQRLALIRKSMKK